MTGARIRALSAVVAAAACAITLSLTPAVQSGVRALMAEVSLIANEGFIMGGTGTPVPGTDYLTTVENLYLPPGYDYQPLPTPEQFCPFVCSSSEPDLTFGQSVNAGVGDLDSAIVPDLKDGDNVSVLGYSQSATIASVEMNNLLANTPAGVNLDDLHVTLLGDPNSPIGGILDRFQFPDGVSDMSLTPEGQHVPFVDIPLSLGDTPTTGIATDIYTGEYDGFADFPSDPTNIFADINALIGIETVHPYYPDPTPGVNLDTSNIINLGTIGDTNYYAIPAPLPTLAFLYDGGPAGQFFYDSLSPSATLSDDWAYGNPGDPGAGYAVDGVDPIGVAGPWQVDATGQLVASGVDGFLPKMDPLQMLAGMEYAAAQSFIGPTDDLLKDAGQPELSASVVNSLLSGYNATNALDTSLLTEWTNLTASMPSLAPDAVFSGAPLISGQPLIDLVGYGFDAFNYFGA